MPTSAGVKDQRGRRSALILGNVDNPILIGLGMVQNAEGVEVYPVSAQCLRVVGFDFGEDGSSRLYDLAAVHLRLRDAVVDRVFHGVCPHASSPVNFLPQAIQAK